MLLLFSIAWSACPPPEDEALRESLEQAQDAFDAIDWDGLTEHTREATKLVPCARERLSRETIGDVFRLHGWALFSAGHKDAGYWLGAAYGLDPRHRYRRKLRGPMAAAWTEARTTWAGSKPVPGGWVANGGAGRPVSDELPWVAQQLDPGGRVSMTYLVEPGGRDPTATRKQSGGGGKGLDLSFDRDWVIAGAAGFAAGLALVTTAAVTKAQYKRNPTKGLYTANLVTATAGIGLLAGGASVAVVGVLK